MKKDQVKNQKQVPATKVVTDKGLQIAFPYIHVPRAASEGQEPRFSACLLIPKADKDTLAKINAGIAAAKQQGSDQWNGGGLDLKLPLRDGDVEKPESPAFQGMYFMNASSKSRPGVVDRALNEIVDPGQIYSGCFCRASVNFYPYNQNGNAGVGCGLNHLQKLADGSLTSERAGAEEDFSVVEEDDEDLLG